MRLCISPLRSLALAVSARAATPHEGLAPPAWLTPAAVLALIFTALHPPGLAWAQDLTPALTIAEGIRDFLVGDFARAIAAIGLAACGFLAFAGRMPWSVAIAVIAGIVLIFGAVTMVDEIADIAEGGGGSGGGGPGAN